MYNLVLQKAKEDLKHADSLDGQSFEPFMVKTLNKVGYRKVKRTPPSNDHGIDAYSIPDSIGWQFKNYAKNHKVPFHAVEECVFGSHVYNLRTNVVLTTSGFSKNTIRLVKQVNHNNPEHPIILIDRDKLFQLFIKIEANEPQVNPTVKNYRQQQYTYSEKYIKYLHSRNAKLEEAMEDSSHLEYFDDKIKQFAFLTLRLCPVAQYIPHLRDKIDHCIVHGTRNWIKSNEYVPCAGHQANKPVYYMRMKFIDKGYSGYQSMLFIYYPPEIIKKYYSDSYPAEYYPQELSRITDSRYVISNMMAIPTYEFSKKRKRNTTNDFNLVSRNFIKLGKDKYISHFASATPRTDIISTDGHIYVDDINTIVDELKYYTNPVWSKKRTKLYNFGRKNYLDDKKLDDRIKRMNRLI